MRSKIEKIKYCHVAGSDNRSFTIDHVRVFPDEQITFHQHEFLEISYIVLGSGIRMIGDTLEPFSKGEVVFIPPNLPHSWSFDNVDTAEDGRIENITIFFSADLLKNALLNIPELQPGVTKLLNYKEALVFKGSTLTRIQELMTAMTAESEIEGLSTLIKIFSLITNAKQVNVVGRHTMEDKRTRKLQQVYGYVMNNFQRSLTLEEASKFIGMDKSSFCTFFKRMTGKSFVSFVTECRIDSAAQMLQKTSLSVAEICVSAGFNDVPHFNRVFKKTKKMTPSEYRRAGVPSQ